jgi:hypothetical protein
MRDDAEVVWLFAGDAIDLETAVLDALDEADEADAVGSVPAGCGSLELARLRRSRASAWPG